MDEPIVKFHDSAKSMILATPCQDLLAGSAGGGESILGKVDKPPSGQGAPKGRFCAAKSFAIGSKKRLSKALAAAGIASRRAAEEIIFEGRVKVNGAVVKVPQTLVDWNSDTIVVDGEPINGEEKKVYYILNKPHGFVCSNARIGSKKLVIDLFAHLNLRLFTIGRLDRDTTGLLLVTNDGHFANKVIHPSSNISKEYLIKTSQEITDIHLKEISKGTYIEDTWVKPVKVEKVRKGTLKVVVKEGKKREVRLLVQNAGLDILELSRIRIGGLRLGPIPEGTFREMTESEKKVIFQSC